jgi:enoyl reductase-like protein
VSVRLGKVKVAPSIDIDYRLLVGTRFMCTTEAEIHQNVKDVMVKSTERDTVRNSLPVKVGDTS